MQQHHSQATKSRYGGLVGTGCAVLIVIGVTFGLHARFALGEKPQPRQPLTVETVEYVIQDRYQRDVSYLGLVTAGRQATLGFETAGTVATLPWREGSPIAQGEVIAQLDDASLQASARATRAELQQARSELELANLKARRQGELRETGAVSREAYDETRLRAESLKSRVEAVSANLQSIEIRLDKAVLRAPYTGVIADRFVHEGAVVNPGTPVVHFIETGGREAHIGVAVHRAAAMKPGDQYSLSLRGRSLATELLSLRPDVDPVTRVMTAVFAVPDEVDAVDGEPVTLTLQEDIPSKGGWLPLSALLEGNRGLWTVLRLAERDGATVTVREAVEVLEIQGNRAYVIGSLPDRSLVVASGVHRISPGTPITPGVN